MTEFANPRSRLAKNRRDTLLELALFVAIGGSAALIYAVISALLIGLQTGVPDWLVSGLCYAVMVPLVYLLHHLVSFRSAASHRQALSRYLAVQALGVCLASLFSIVCHDWLQLKPFVAGLAVAVLVAAFNFTLSKLWAFAVPRESVPS